jgi:small GTP-binding protein
MSSLINYIKQKRKIRKILIAGSGATGKTSLVKVLKTGTSLSNMEANLEYHRTLYLQLEKIFAGKNGGIFQLYDVAGQLDLPIHAFRDTAKLTFGNVDIVILVFANDNIQSLLDIERWLSLVDEYYKTENATKKPPFVLINNKTDLEAAADNSLISSIVDQQNDIIKYFELSCLTGKGVYEFKTWIAEYFFGDHGKEVNINDGSKASREST